MVSLACQESCLTSVGLYLPCWLSTAEQVRCWDASAGQLGQRLRLLLFPSVPRKGTASEDVPLRSLGEASHKHSFLLEMGWI